MRVMRYSMLDYVSVELAMGDAIPEIEEKHVRFSIPTERGFQKELVQAGHVLVDRTIEVKVPLKKNKMDFSKFCRMPILLEPSRKEEIYELALHNFKNDRRFNVMLEPQDEKVYEGILHQWVDEQEDVFACNYKEKVIGFADVRLLETYSNVPFIYLAAVDEKYRASGAAMSLYAFVFQYMKEKGHNYVYGRISSQNMAVMNLYASFGATFANPYDVYIRR